MYWSRKHHGKARTLLAGLMFLHLGMFSPFQTAAIETEDDPCRKDTSATLSAVPSTIEEGASVTLNWTIHTPRPDCQTQVLLSPPLKTYTYTGQHINDSTTEFPATTTTYRLMLLTGENLDGVTVTVIPPQPEAECVEPVLPDRIDFPEIPPVQVGTGSSGAKTALLYHGAFEADPELLGPGELDMMAGRLTQVPVSWVWGGRKRVDNPHTFRVRAVCPNTATRWECDPAMVVLACVGSSCTRSTHFADDDARAGSSPLSSYLELNSANTTIYDVHVFSMNRATSRVDRIEYSLDGRTWHGIWDEPCSNKPAAVDGRTPQHIGGTLIKVGALQPKDGLEVRTPKEGFGNQGTRMWLFTTAQPQAHIFSNNQGQTDQDPFIPIPDDTWGTPENYVLLGKDTRRASKAGTETFVDLVRLPLESPVGTVTMQGNAECDNTVCMGNSITLPPGRYYAAIKARLPQHTALGQFDPQDATTFHNASELGTTAEIIRDAYGASAPCCPPPGGYRAAAGGVQLAFVPR